MHNSLVATGIKVPQKGVEIRRLIEKVLKEDPGVNAIIKKYKIVEKTCILETLEAKNESIKDARVKS